MIRKINKLTPAFCMAALLGLSIQAADAQLDMAALVEEALDQTNDFEVVDKPLSAAFLLVAEQTGVAIHVSAATLALLPDGPGTRMTARMKDNPLRDGIDQLLKPLGMCYRVAGDGLHVEPSAPLRRIGRRATWNELKTLQRLAVEQWSPNAKSALPAVFKFSVGSPDPQARLLEAMSEAGAGSVAKTLDDACRMLGWAWYPSGDGIVISSLAEQMGRDMRSPVTLTAKHRPLSEILADLATQSGVAFRFESNAIGSLSRQAQHDCSVRFENLPLEQALEILRAETGLTFRIDGDAVVFDNPHRAKRDDPVAAILVIPGRGEIPIHERDLTPEVKALLDTLVEQLIRAAPADDEQ